MILALVFIFMGTALMQVKAAQGNTSYHSNDAMSGDTTWFLGELGYGDDGAIFDGRWRPDSSL